MIAVEYHADLKEVQGDARLASLLGEAAQSSPFDRLAWWQLLAEHCELSPLIAVAVSAAGLAVLPLIAGKGHLRAFANWYSFAWRPLHAGSDPLALFTALARDLRRRAWRVTLGPIPDEQGETAMLERAFTQAGWHARRAQCDVNHVLGPAGRSFDAYLAARPGQLRNTIRRKAGKLDVTVTRQFDAETWDAYEDVYRASWKPEEGSPAFLRAFAQAEGAADRLRLGLARHEGRAVAAQFWTVDNGTACIHKLAHLDTACELSPGTVLSAAMFRAAIDDDRVALIDFGTGDDPYKRDWMEAVRPRFRLDLFDPAKPRSWPYLARGALQQLAEPVRHG